MPARAILVAAKPIIKEVIVVSLTDMIREIGKNIDVRFISPKVGSRRYGVNVTNHSLKVWPLGSKKKRGKKKRR